MYNMEIALAYADLEIIKSSVDEVQVTVKQSRRGALTHLPEDIIIEENDSALCIREPLMDEGFSLKNVGRFLNFGGRNIFLCIEVPEAYAVDAIDIKMGAGDLRLSGVEAATLAVRNKYGDIKCQDVAFDHVEMHLIAGDVKYFGGLKSVVIESKAGDVKVDPLGVLETAAIKMGAGDVRLCIENPRLYNIFTKLSVGDLKYKRYGDLPLDTAPDATRQISVESKIGDVRFYKSFD